MVAAEVPPALQALSTVPRVRIAPSPTGDPHVGTAYIALFNFAFARRHRGAFVLRIEDTDRERSSEASERAIFGALHWLGLEWDEGPDVGGPDGPYRQSERTEIYHRHAQMLLDRGAAYRCFCSRERLEQLRREQMARKEDPRYDGHCRSLEPGEAAARAAGDEPHVVRLAVPVAGETVVQDILRGEVRIANTTIDDQVLIKSDGFPTYHLANVVDDHLMRITHVIRGEDWLVSTPKHILLYRAFDWPIPVFCHLGLLRNADKSKLSKRKNPVSVFHYRDRGYLPATFLNFLGTLGFSMPDERERFSLQEMIEHFELNRLRAGGPVFDVRKLDAFNGDDIRALDSEVLGKMLIDHAFGGGRLPKLVELTRERIAHLDDFIPYAAFFFGGAVDYGAVLPHFRLKKRSRAEIMEILRKFVDELEKDPSARAFTAETLEPFARSFCERHGWKPREVFTLLRISATGRTAAPPLFDTLVALGKDRVRMRLRDAVSRLQAEPDW